MNKIEGTSLTKPKPFLDSYCTSWTKSKPLLIVTALHEQNQNHSWIVIALHALKLAAGVHHSIATRHFNAMWLSHAPRCQNIKADRLVPTSRQVPAWTAENVKLATYHSLTGLLARVGPFLLTVSQHVQHHLSWLKYWNMTSRHYLSW